MKIITTFAFLTLLIATGVDAQPSTEGLKEVGRFNAEIGDEQVTFLALSDPENNYSDLTTQNTAGFLSMNVAGQEMLADGTFGQRVLSILIGPYRGDIPNEATLEVYAPDGILAANIDTGLVVSLTNVKQDGENLSFSFKGKVVPAENADGMMVPVDGGMPLDVSGDFTGLFPKAE